MQVSHGYRLVGADWGVFTFGAAGFHGSTGNLALQRPVVGIAPTVDRTGYWLVATGGGVFAFGDAGFHGSLPGLGISPAGCGRVPSLNAPIVGMVPSTDDRGYFMVAPTATYSPSETPPSKGRAPVWADVGERRIGTAGRQRARLLAGGFHGELWTFGDAKANSQRLVTFGRRWR